MSKNQQLSPTDNAAAAINQLVDNALDEELDQSNRPKVPKSRSDNSVHVNVNESVGALFLGLLALLLLIALLRAQANYRKLAERLLQPS
jgi:hypothetical protein